MPAKTDGAQSLAAVAGRRADHRAGAQHRAVSRLVLPITLGRPKSIAAAQQAVRDQRQVGILLQRDPEVADPAAVDMHRMGTLANIVRYITAPDGSHHLVCQGEQRFQIVEYLSGWPFFVARVLQIPEPETATPRSRRVSSI